MKPQEPIPHNYSIRGLNLIFLWSSLARLAVTGLMVGHDYIRGWKWFQIEFMRMQQERIEQDIHTAETETSKAQLTALDRQVKQIENDIARHRSQYVGAQKDLDSWEGIHYAADQDYRFAKARLDAQRYIAEASVVEKRRDAAQQQAEYKRQEQHVTDLNIRLQDLTRKRDGAKESVDVWLGKIKDLDDKRKVLTGNIDLLNKQLSTVELKGPNLILNLPMLDFINPTLKIDQVVIPDMFVEMNYMVVPRVDRCQTCHRAIDRPGFESKKEAARLSQELQQKLDTYQIPQEKRDETEKRIEQLKRIADAPQDTLNPWRTHPKLDTFVGSASPHPLLEYGCTGCHRRQDRATEFGRAGHIPPNHKMEERWSDNWGVFSAANMLRPWRYLTGAAVMDNQRRTWGWEENEFNETPMFPRQYYESGCIKCHAGQIGVDQGEAITKAEATVELYGCYACHKISNWRFTDLRKPGPDLNGIAEKTTPPWAIRWISEPHNFRSTTRMPSFFYQRHMIDPKVVPPIELAQNIKYQD